MTKNYLFKILVICAVFCQFFTKAQAQYAIGGTAGNTLTKSVYWLTWDPTATGSTLISAPTNSDSQHILNGTYVWQYSPTVRITAVISNEVFVGGITMQAYTPGNFTGDGLDLLYSGNNLPKPDSRGVEASGLATTGNETATFDIDVKVAILINGVYTDVVYPGMVIGDAESIDDQGEYISGDTPNPVAWQLLNKRTQGNVADTHYLMDLSNGGRSFKLYADLAPGNFGVQAVMFAHGARSLTNLSMRGSGITAMAIGFVLPFDQGDAPATYGSTGHYIDDFVITDFFAGNGTYSVVNYPTTPLTPQATVYIGANNVDADGTTTFGALADGDDNVGNADESTLAPNSLADLKVNQSGNYSLTVPVTNTKAVPATLYGWIDFNNDGVFGADEVVTVTVPANTNNQNVTLTYPNALFASKIKTGLLYARLRISTTNLLDVTGTTIDERSTAYAADGEVEDYKLKSILGVTLSGTVRDDPNGNLDGVISGTALSTVSGAQLYAYLITGTTILNKATVAANGTYSFTDTNNGVYTVAISTNNVAIGGTLASVAANLPAGWVASGESYGLNNNGNTGLETGTPNLQIQVSPTPGSNLDVTGIDFGLDQIPVANADVATTTAGQAVAVAVLANDTDADGTIDVTSVRVIDPADNVGKTTVTIAGQGTYTVNTTTGVVTFTPLAAFSGASTPVTYSIKDNFGAASASTVTATISVSVRPVGVNDNAFTPVNTPVTTNVRANDGAGNATATVTAGNGAHGTTTVNAANQVIYTPAAGYIGTDTYTYTLTLAGLVSDPITVTVLISNTPVGVADVVTTPINTPTTTTVTANDGADGVGATVTAGSTAPSHGAIVVNANGTITYTPVATYVGKDTYTYIITKNGLPSTPITVTINIKPVGVIDSDVTLIGVPVTTTVKGNDGASGIGTTVTATNGTNGTTVVNGTGQVTYTPTGAFIGTDTYTYILTTPDGVASDPITVAINVSNTPVGSNDFGTTPIATPITTNVLANDGAFGAGSTVNTATAPLHGSLLVNPDNTITYTPVATYTGIDTYTYTITKSGLTSAPITVTIRVQPVGVNDLVTTPLNTAVQTNVKGNDGPSGTGTTVIPTNGTNGTTLVNAAGLVTYIPTNNYIGLDTYTYTLTTADGVVSAPTTVNVTIRPVGVPDASSTPLNTPVATAVTANDGISATGAFVIAGNGAHGTTTVVGGVVTFTPTAGYVGVDTYTYTLTNNSAVSSPITVTITVTPAGVADAATTPLNTPVATTVLANDGPSGVGATVTATNGAHGSTTVNVAGVVTFTPTANYIGTDVYTYTITNSGATSAPINVTVTIRPVGVADASSTAINTAVTTAVLSNDGLSGTGAVVTPTNGAHGTTTVNAAGVVTFTPTTGYIGLDTYTYTLTNNGAVSDPVTVTITVIPAGVADVATTPLNTPVATTVLANDGASGVGATVAATNGAHGTTTVNAAGVVTFTPTTDYIGLDTYTYTLTNGGATSAPITVTVRVRPAGVADAATTPLNTPVTTIVKTNDGASATGTTVTAGNGTNGTTTVNAAGAVTYTPATGFTGVDTYVYTLITTDGVVSDPVTVTVTVSPLPAGSADIVITAINTAITTTVTANDADGVGAVVAGGTTAPAHGTILVNANGTITYTPATDYIGQDSYTYILTKGGQTSAQITVTIGILPVGVADVATTTINTPVAITVKGNDGPSGINTTVTPTIPAHGTTTVSPAGVVTYTPTTGYTGPDTFTYTLLTPDGVESNPIAVTLTISAAAGLADVDATPYNTPVTTTVKANDGAGNATATVVATNGSHGTTTVNANGQVTYTPVNYAGLDTYTYTLNNGSGVSSPITVTISVKPVGTFDGAITPINTPVTTSVKSNDGPSAVGTTVIPLNGSHGTTTVDANGNVTYTPATNYTGTDTYTYTLKTPDGVLSDPISVTVSVRLIGVADAVNTPLNTPVTTNVKANDGVSGNGATVTPTNGSHGTTTVNATGLVTYTPDNGYIGLDTYTYILSIPGAVSDPITVTVNIRVPGVPDVYTTLINTVINTNVKINDGASNANATVTPTQPLHGQTSVNGNGIVTYIPAADYVGLDSYTYTLTSSDGAVSAPILVSITIKPVAVADQATTNVNTPVAITVKTNDGPSGTGATVTPTQPLHGTTTVSPTGVVTYTPATGYLGTDTFTYTLTNNGVVSDPITVTVSVLTAGVPDVYTTLINTVINTNVKINDGIDNANATVTQTQPSHGQTSVNTNGIVTYIPAADYVGLDSYTYTLTSSDGTVSAPILVSITVNPIAIPDNATATINTPVTIPVKTNDGASGVGATVVPTQPLHGTITVDAAGIVTYTPTPGYLGPDTFTYVLVNNGATSAPVTVTISVKAAGVADADSTPINTPVTVDVKANDGPLAATATVVANQPAHGTTVVNATGTVTYTPTTGYVGVDTYTYTLVNNGIPSDPITVTITVYNATMSLTKVVNNTGTKAGDVLNYTMVVTNTGTVALTNVIVTDLGADAGSVTPANIGNLAVGASATVTARHTLTQADIDAGGYTNQASVKAIDPKGNPTIPVVSDDPTTPGAGDGTKTVITPVSGIKLVKTGVSTVSTITYTFVFTNIGNTTLSAVSLTDTKLGIVNLPMAIPAGGLLPGASIIYTSVYTITQADKDAGSVQNSASATGTDPKGNPTVSTGSTGSTTTTVPPPPIAVNDGATTSGNQPVMIPVLTNDNPGSATFIPTSVEIVTPPAHGTVVVNPDGTMTYTPSNGYSGPDTYTYRVKDTNGYYTNIATVTINNSYVGVTPPTLFTPNGDGINDTFEIRGLGQYYQNELSIVNRWGNQVYKTNNYTNTWAGEGLNEGTYYYVLRVKLTAADDWQTITGWVTLLRTFKK